MKIKNKVWKNIRYRAEMMELNFEHIDEVKRHLNKLLSEIKTEDIRQENKE